MVRRMSSPDEVLESLFASHSARLVNPSLSPRMYCERKSLRNRASFSSLSFCTFLSLSCSFSELSFSLVSSEEAIVAIARWPM
uniref:Uncharacterized protein n=1 Tax=Arundo donax TaxID=35708 RepID=A0A0A9CJ58_ARUDO